jgi:S1-C subfamily serine protease
MGGPVQERVPTAEPAPGSAVTSGARARGYTGFDLTRSASLGNAGTVTPKFPVIATVERGSPAATAGLLVGDTIIEVNGKDSRQPGANFYQVGVTYVLRIQRGGSEREITIVPVATPRQDS